MARGENAVNDEPRRRRWMNEWILRQSRERRIHVTASVPLRDARFEVLRGFFSSPPLSSSWALCALRDCTSRLWTSSSQFSWRMRASLSRNSCVLWFFFAFYLVLSIYVNLLSNSPFSSFLRFCLLLSSYFQSFSILYVIFSPIFWLFCSASFWDRDWRSLKTKILCVILCVCKNFERKGRSDQCTNEFIWKWILMCENCTQIFLHLEDENDKVLRKICRAICFLKSLNVKVFLYTKFK